MHKNEEVTAEESTLLGSLGRPIPVAEWVAALPILRAEKEHECPLGALSPRAEDVLREIRGSIPTLRMVLLLIVLVALTLDWMRS